MKNQIFISGIDTDCGKTYITGLLAYHFNKSGINCMTSKLVQTGCSGIAEDIIEHRKTMEIPIQDEDKNGSTCPFVYSFPASPHLAAEIDQLDFDINKTTECFSALAKNYELLLIEGAGGLTVPLTKNLLTFQYLQENQLPLILVSSSKLGSINHTLLSIDFCINNNIKLLAVVYNQFPGDDVSIAKSSFDFLEEYLSSNHPEVHLIHGRELDKGGNFNDGVKAIMESCNKYFTVLAQ